MSIRQMFPGSIVKPGFNPLAAQGLLYNFYSWGQNTAGQLGLGNTTNYSSPKQIGSETNWSIFSSGQNSTTAIKTDGTLWAWGANDFGQLGLGTSGAGAYKSSPTQVGTLTNWAKVSIGYDHTLAVKTDGTLWSWGRNAGGYLGLGNTTNYSSPKQVGALTNWSSVSAKLTV